MKQTWPHLLLSVCPPGIHGAPRNVLGYKGSEPVPWTYCVTLDKTVALFGPLEKMTLKVHTVFLK